MWRQMPERFARICLFSPPLLCPHQQIITFTHLQQAVQSPLAGLMAMVARESWFRHRPTSWQSNQDLSASIGKVIFPRSLYLMLLLPKMLEFCLNGQKQIYENCAFRLLFHNIVYSHDEHWPWQSIVCTDFGTSTGTRVQLFNCDPI